MGTSRLVLQSSPVAPLASPVDYPHISPAEDLKFHQLTVDDGLSSNLVRSIVQDFTGFIWVATGDGLNKYDGTGFTVYRHHNDIPTSLASNDINVLFVDAQGTLWVGTNGNGLDRYDRQMSEFQHFVHDPANPHSISSDLILSIFQDNRGDLWIGTVGGLNKFIPRANKFQRFVNSPDDQTSLVSNSIFSIQEDGSGNLWVGTGNGLDRMDDESGIFTHFRHDPENPTSLSSNAVLVIYRDAGGELWIGTEGGGVNRYDPTTESFHRFLDTPLDPSDPSTDRGISVRAIIQIDTNIWVGTLGNGIFALSTGDGSIRHYRNDPRSGDSLSDDRIQAIYPDRSGLLWIATAGGGISQLDINRNRFHAYANVNDDPNSLSTGGVLAVVQSTGGDIWVGTDGSGLDRINPETGRVIHFLHDPTVTGTLSNNHVKALYLDHAGILWIGTDRGLNRFDPVTATFTVYLYDPRNRQSLGDNRITAITEDQHNVLWIGTQAGLERFNRTTETFDHYYYNANDPGSLIANHIWSLLIDETNTLWVGTAVGLDRYDRANNRFIHVWSQLQDPPRLTDHHILSLFLHSDGQLWIGTMGGLNRYDPATDQLTTFTLRDGLPNEYIYCMVEDRDGYLWLSTNGGLARMDLSTNSILNFTQDDGLLSNSFNQNACATSRDGRLFFGAQNGLNDFNPSHIRQNPFIPPVILTSVTQGGLPIDPAAPTDELSRIILRWPNNYFEFEFAALSYSQPEENRFAYMLENYDSDWKTATPGQSGRYANLPAGNYTLNIKASNNDGVWNDTGSTIDVVVLAPFWQSAWFQWGLLVSLLAIVGIGVQLRVYSINQRNRMLSAQVAERTREIEQRRKAAEGLKQILILLNSNRPLEESLKFILQQTCLLLSADQAYLLEFGENDPTVLTASGNFEKGDDQVAFHSELLTWLRVQTEDARTRVLDPLPPALAERAGTVILQPLQPEGTVTAALLVLFNQKKRVNEEEINLLKSFSEQISLAIGNDRLRKQAQELAILSERNRLARDLHDAVSQALFSASLITESLPAIWEKDPEEGQTMLQDLHRLNRGALAEMRTLLMELRPAAISEARLDDLLRQLVDAIVGRTSLEIKLDIDCQDHLPTNVQDVVYRITQEALHNIVKHAHASKVHIKVQSMKLIAEPSVIQAPVEVILEIEDDGCGFDPMNVPPDHFGIQNMRERAVSVGATLELNSQSNCGTIIRFIWQGICE